MCETSLFDYVCFSANQLLFMNPLMNTRTNAETLYINGFSVFLCLKTHAKSLADPLPPPSFF